jgi:hypothetical protein
MRINHALSMNAGCSVLIRPPSVSISSVRKKRESQLLHESNFHTKYLFGQRKVIAGFRIQQEVVTVIGFTRICRSID